MEVGLGPGEFVFDWDPATPKKGRPTPHNFWLMSLWPNGWMDEDATCTEVDLGPGHIVLDGSQAPSSPRKRHSSSPLFGPCLLLLWLRSPISATAELLLNETTDQRHRVSSLISQLGWQNLFDRRRKTVAYHSCTKSARVFTIWLVFPPITFSSFFQAHSFS